MENVIYLGLMMSVFAVIALLYINYTDKKSKKMSH